MSIVVNSIVIGTKNPTKQRAMIEAVMKIQRMQVKSRTDHADRGDKPSSTLLGAKSTVLKVIPATAVKIMPLM